MQAPHTIASKKSLWAWAPALLLTAMLAGLGTMVTIAARDPGFAVEPDYYQKAVHWDREREQLAENERLGFEFEVEVSREPVRAGRTVRALVSDALGAKVTRARIELTTFHNGRASELLRCTLSESSPGVYECALPMQRPGLWELRFAATRQGQRFTHVTRLDLEPRQALQDRQELERRDPAVAP